MGAVQQMTESRKVSCVVCRKETFQLGLSSHYRIGYQTDLDDAKWKQFPHVLQVWKKDKIKQLEG